MANNFKNYFLKNANTTAQNVYVAGAGEIGRAHV